MTGLGSMGQSMPAAIGAQLAHPDRVVATIVGDGCFAMNAFEIATAVNAKLPLIIFVINDGRLGMVEIGATNVYGRTAELSDGADGHPAAGRGARRADGRGRHVRQRSATPTSWSCASTVPSSSTCASIRRSRSPNASASSALHRSASAPLLN